MPQNSISTPHAHEHHGKDIESLDELIDVLLGKQLQIIWRDEPKQDTESDSGFAGALQISTISGDTNKNLTEAFLDARKDSDSYKAIAVKINNEARQIFLDAGEHIPLFVLAVNQNEDGEAREGVALFDASQGMVSDATKQLVADLVKTMVGRFDSDMVIMVSETWMLKAETADAVAHIKPSQSKDRIEALVLTLNTKDGASVVITNKIIRMGDDVSLGEAEVSAMDKQKSTGLFSGWWD